MDSKVPTAQGLCRGVYGGSQIGAEDPSCGSHRSTAQQLVHKLSSEQYTIHHKLACDITGNRNTNTHIKKRILSRCGQHAHAHAPCTSKSEAALCPISTTNTHEPTTTPTMIEPSGLMHTIAIVRIQNSTIAKPGILSIRWYR
jgi:hypothetical protein